MSRPILASIEAEYRRYRRLSEDALRQLEDDELFTAPVEGANSVAVLLAHLSGNLVSRFTDFLTSDGEKPWRHREEEFASRRVERAELMARWERGWGTLFTTLAELSDEDLGREVRIRGQALTVIEALQRSLAHLAYHVGQIVLVARAIRGPSWSFLSVPPGQSESYNRRPTLERPPSGP